MEATTAATITSATTMSTTIMSATTTVEQVMSAAITNTTQSMTTKDGKFFLSLFIRIFVDYIELLLIDNFEIGNDGNLTDLTTLNNQGMLHCHL